MTYVVLDQMAVNKDLTAIPEAGDVIISIFRHRDAERVKTLSLYDVAVG